MPDVSFRISVQGGRESQEDVLAVRQALAGVRSDLDGASAASRIFGKSQDELSAAEKRTVVEMSAATAPAVQWTSALRGATTQQENHHRSLSEGVRLTRTFTDALLGQVPVLGNAASALTQVLRETSGFSAAMAAGAVAAVTAAAVFGKFVEAANAAAEAQARANTAIANMDFSAALSGLTGLREAQIATANNWDIIGQKGPASIDSLAASLRILGGETFDRTTDKTAAWARALNQTWESSGRVESSAKSMLASLKADQAGLENLAQTAPLEQLSGVFMRLQGNLRAQGDEEVRLMQVERDRYASSIAQQVVYLREQGREADAVRLMQTLQASLGDKDAEIAARRLASSAAVAAREISDAQRVAEAKGQQLAIESRLESAIVRRAQVALGAAQQEADASLAAARADAQFFGTSLQGLESYQVERRARIVAEGQLEIADIQQRAAADRAALVQRMNAVPQYGAEWQRLNTQLRAQDEETQNAIQTKDAETQNKLRQEANQTTEERRANYARELALADQHYRLLEALGQGDVVARIRQFEQVARDENASYDTRAGAAREAYATRRQLEADLFNLVKANGLVTERDAVAHAAAVAASWKQGSQQRRQAETQFAEQVRALWSTLSQTGGQTMSTVADMLKERFGIVNATLAEQRQFWPQLIAEAQQYLGVWQAGGYVTEEMKRQITAVADVQDRLTRGGVTFSQAAGTYFADLANKLSATLTPTTQLVTQMDRLGIETGQAGQVAEGAANEISTAFGDAGRNLVTGFRNAFDEIDSMAREFMRGLGSTISSGVGQLGEDIGRIIINAVKNSLDDSANRS